MIIIVNIYQQLPGRSWARPGRGQAEPGRPARGSCYLIYTASADMILHLVSYLVSYWFLTWLHTRGRAAELYPIPSANSCYIQHSNSLPRAILVSYLRFHALVSYPGFIPWFHTVLPRPPVSYPEKNDLILIY